MSPAHSEKSPAPVNSATVQTNFSLKPRASVPNTSAGARSRLHPFESLPTPSVAIPLSDLLARSTVAFLGRTLSPIRRCHLATPHVPAAELRAKKCPRSRRAPRTVPAIPPFLSARIPLRRDAPENPAAAPLHLFPARVSVPRSHFHLDTATSLKPPAQSPAKSLLPPIDTALPRVAPKYPRVDFSIPTEMYRMPEAPPLRPSLLETA